MIHTDVIGTVVPVMQGRLTTLMCKKIHWNLLSLMIYVFCWYLFCWKCDLLSFSSKTVFSGNDKLSCILRTLKFFVTPCWFSVSTDCNDKCQFNIVNHSDIILPWTTTIVFFFLMFIICSLIWLCGIWFDFSYVDSLHSIWSSSVTEPQFIDCNILLSNGWQ